MFVWYSYQKNDNPVPKRACGKPHWARRGRRQTCAPIPRLDRKLAPISSQFREQVAIVPRGVFGLLPQRCNWRTRQLGQLPGCIAILVAIKSAFPEPPAVPDLPRGTPDSPRSSIVHEERRVPIGNQVGMERTCQIVVEPSQLFRVAGAALKGTLLGGSTGTGRALPAIPGAPRA